MRGRWIVASSSSTSPGCGATPARSWATAAGARTHAPAARGSGRDASESREVKPLAEAELHTYIDGALSEGARAEIEAWLASHPEDAERLRAYAEQNALLRSLYNPVLDEPVPAALLAVRPHAGLRYAAAAAIFALGIGLGWIVRGMFNTPQMVSVSLARLAAAAHGVCSAEVRHPVEVPAGEEGHLVNWLSQALGTTLKAPKLAPLGYELVGGRLLSGPQGPVAHFMYQD